MSHLMDVDHSLGISSTQCRHALPVWKKVVSAPSPRPQSLSAGRVCDIPLFSACLGNPAAAGCVAAKQGPGVKRGAAAQADVSGSDENGVDVIPPVLPVPPLPEVGPHSSEPLLRRRRLQAAAAWRRSGLWARARRIGSGLKEGDGAEGLVRVLDLHDDDARAPAQGGEAEQDLPLEPLDVDHEQLEAGPQARRREEVVQRALRGLDDLARVVAGAPVEARVDLQPCFARARRRQERFARRVYVLFAKQVPRIAGLMRVCAGMNLCFASAMHCSACTTSEFCNINGRHSGAYICSEQVDRAAPTKTLAFAREDPMARMCVVTLGLLA